MQSSAGDREGKDGVWVLIARADQLGAEHAIEQSEESRKLHCQICVYSGHQLQPNSAGLVVERAGITVARRELKENLDVLVINWKAPHINRDMGVSGAYPKRLAQSQDASDNQNCPIGCTVGTMDEGVDFRLLSTEPTGQHVLYGIARLAGGSRGDDSVISRR